MKRISFKMIKMLWKALTDERYVIVTLDEWNENAIEWYNEGIRKGIELSKEQGVNVMEDQATEC
jgi:hypothetical protein